MEKPMSDWSWLPYDILSEIVLKLDTLEDFVYFSATCHAWNHASSLIKSKWCSKVPWLLLAENTVNDHDHFRTTRKLFSLNKNKRYEFKLSPTFGARCWGTSCGWIVVFNISMQISLFNPLTQARILLPPQSTMPLQLEDYRDDGSIEHREFLLHGYIRKAFVWKITTNYDDLMIIAIHGNFERVLGFVRPGDKVWTPIINPEEKCAVDIAYYGGQMFILYDDGALGCCNMSEACSLQPLKVMNYLQAPRGILDKIRKRIHSLYMVNSYGDLLMVLRYKIDYIKGDDEYDHTDADEEDEEEYEEGYEPLFYKTTTFEVFRLDFEMKKWEQIEDIGDVALFVGDNCSMSLRASYANNYKGNCIYFTDDESQFWDPSINVGRHDMRMYDMNTRQFETFYEGDDIRSEICTPLWFIPSF